MNEKVKGIIDEVIRTKSKRIEFHDCQLTTMPDKILEMDWLEELIIFDKTEDTEGSLEITLPNSINKLKELKKIVIFRYGFITKGGFNS